MGFDVAGARKAGYSPQEIADHLAQESNFDAAAARKAGYSDDEIIAHLSGAQTVAEPNAKPVLEMSPDVQGPSMAGPKAVGEIILKGAAYPLVKGFAGAQGLYKLATNQGNDKATESINDVMKTLELSPEAQAIMEPIGNAVVKGTKKIVETLPATRIASKLGPAIEEKFPGAADIAEPVAEAASDIAGLTGGAALAKGAVKGGVKHAVETTVEAEGRKILRTKNGQMDLTGNKIDRVDVAEHARGKGEGTALYKQAVADAAADNKPLLSDVSVSPDAEAIVIKLENEGYRVKRNPATRSESTGNLVSDDPKKSVFEIQPPAATAADINTPRGRRNAMQTIGDALATRFGSKEMARRAVERQATGHQVEIIGPKSIQARLVNELEKPGQEIVPGSKPTAAELVAETPGGAGVVADQNLMSRQPGVPNAGFASRAAEREAAIQKLRDETYEAHRPAREAALDLANERGAADARLLARGPAPQKLVRGLKGDEGYVYHATNTDRLNEIARTGELRTHRPHEFTDQSMWPDGSVAKRAYFGKSPENLYQFAPPEGQPVVLRAKAGPQFKQESTGDIFTNKTVSASDLEYLGSDGAWHPVKSLVKRTDIKGIKSGEIRRTITNMLRQPDIGASKVARKTLTEIKYDIARMMDPETGLIDARALDTIRKEVGNKVQQFAAESKTWDKRKTAGLTRRVQLLIDDAIENAGGKGYKQSLADFSEAMSKIDKEALRAEAKPPVKATTVGHKIGIQNPLPNTLSRTGTVFNAVIRIVGKNLDERVATELARRYLNPSEMAKALRGEPPTPSMLAKLSRGLGAQATTNAPNLEQERRRQQAAALMGAQ